MTTNELREAFQAFFEERGHLRVPPHSLIPPADDQTTLFIVAGMQQFKPYFLRTKEPPSDRVVSVQPCLRAGGKDTDLEDVGRTDRHNSFFEMMGNFSFGDYFKDEAVDYAYEWVTQVLGLDPQRLWATVHEGDPVLSLDEDTVAIEAWKRVGIPEERIVRLGKDNFWQAAEVGPCGQCSEIFYDRGEARACGDPGLRPRPLRPLHGDLQPRLHGVRPPARQRAGAAPEPERRHGDGRRAHGDGAAGRRLELRHRRFPRDHGLGRARVRRRLSRQRGRDAVHTA